MMDMLAVHPLSSFSLSSSASLPVERSSIIFYIGRVNAPQIIIKKRDGGILTPEEIGYMVEGAAVESLPKYQIAAWLMAIYFRGLNGMETAQLTQAIIDSGKRIALDPACGPYVDKHSTGGVGDGVSLSLAPLAAACGLYVPMISGRALGHTGGTLDKLDAIKGYRTAMSSQQFAQLVGEIGYAMSGQSQEITPADKQLYALRDVTGTVESVPLITSSILSKKFAEGAEALVLDVKCGNGAFFTNYKDARRLAQQLLETGSNLGKALHIVMTRMDQPLGQMIGNFLEVEQAAVILGGYSHADYEESLLADIREITYHLVGCMLMLTKKVESIEQAQQKIKEARESGQAWERFCANVQAQGGVTKALKQSFGSFRATEQRCLRAPRTGYLSELPARAFGNAALLLGVGRLKQSDPVVPHSGIMLHRKVGAHLQQGDPLCTLYALNSSALEQASAILKPAIVISDKSPIPHDTMVIEEYSA